MTDEEPILLGGIKKVRMCAFCEAVCVCVCVIASGYMYISFLPAVVFVCVSYMHMEKENTVLMGESLEFHK